MKGVSYTLAFHSKSIKLVSEYAKMPLEITKFDFDKMIPSVLPDGIADGEMQKTEIALRTELLGMPSDKITPSSPCSILPSLRKHRRNSKLPDESQHGSRVAQHSANRDSYPLLRLKMKTDRNIWIMRAGTALLLFGAWEAAQQAGLIDSLFFSSPSLIMRRLISMIVDGSIWPHISASATVISLGFALAVVIGIPMGSRWENRR